MSNQIEFEYKDKKYCLEYNRESIKLMEKQGFDINNFMKQPMTMVDLAFEGAFYKNHSNIKLAEIKEIFENLANKRELANQLLNMISETYNSLFDEDEEKDENSKNIQWKID